MISPKVRSYLTLNTLWLALFIIGFAFFLCGMPKMSDDYWYMAAFRPWFEKQGILFPENGGNIFRAGIPWNDLFNEYVNRYYMDNIRLGNIIGAFLLIFPKWFGSGLITLMLLSSILLAFKIAGVDWRRTSLMAPVLFMATFMLPWIDQFGSLIYQVNYIFPMWIMLLLYNRLQEYVGAESHTAARIAMILLLGVLAGWSHEGFSLPMIAGLVTLLIFYPKWRKPMVFAVVVIMVGMTLLLLSSPGMRDRFGTQVAGPDSVSAAEALSYLVKCFQAFILMLVIFIWTMSRKQLRGNALSDVVISMLAVAASSFLLVVFTHSGIRASFPAEMASIIIIAYLLHKNPKPRLLRKRSVRNCAVALMLTPIFLFLTANGWLSVKYRVEMRKALAGHVANPDEAIFSDSPIRGRFSPICDYYYFVYPLNFIRQYYESAPVDPHKYTWMVPADLQDVTADGPDEFDNGFFRRNGYFYVPRRIEDEFVNGFTYLDVDYGGGEEFVQALKVCFRSKADGREYFWILTREKFHGARVKKIKSLKYHTENTEEP